MQWKLNIEYFREATLNQAAGPHSQDQSYGQQHCGDLCQTQGFSARQNMDLERGQFWVPWVHEDQQLWGPSRHLLRLHRHVPVLRCQLE